ncbi:MAG: hypothetical protein V3T78_05250, partial [Dehalococcoidia bacterium]
MLPKPGGGRDLDHPNWLETFIASRKGERDLTAKGEIWIRVTLGKFLPLYPDPFIVTRHDIELFLAGTNGPWNRHSRFRAIRAFYNWLESQDYIAASPCHRMKAPKLPSPVLGHPSPSQVNLLIEQAQTVRDKAIISLF